MDERVTNEAAEGERVRAQSIIFRVFMASPGDVQDERKLARAVIDQVGVERAFRERVHLECFAWD